MLLIDMTVRPGYAFPEAEDHEIGPKSTRCFIRMVMGPELPAIFVRNCALFGMDPNTPEDAVQVRFHDYDKDDINVADIMVQIQFSEDVPDKVTRIEIRDAVFEAIVADFRSHGLGVPNNFIVEVSWGPTHGFGCVNRTFFN